MNTKKLSISVIGCGPRGQIYTEFASKMTDKFNIVAAADPLPERIEKIKSFNNNLYFQSFKSADELLSKDKLSDILIIATQDSLHYEFCSKALKKGYDILLEKPISTNLRDVINLERIANENNRKVMVCYVLRFTPFYKKVKSIIDSGMIGDIITLNASEGVWPWHQAHSFVRGHWAVTEKSSPMIVAKCCHDMDIIPWLIGKKCLSISSFGSLTYFTEKNAPDGATKRCTDNCKIKSTCIYNAELYADLHFDLWLTSIFDKAYESTKEEIIEWLRKSQWGRCVYYCDNTAVDHQVISMKFEDSITGTFTMTAFEDGRHLEIFGTKGILKGGSFYKKISGNDLIVTEHGSEKLTSINIDSEFNKDLMHGGGDKGLMDEFYDEMSKVNLPASLHNAVHSHVIAFAAEESRINDKIIDIKDFHSQYLSASPSKEMIEM
jgi:predicted dehydrogenase